MKTDYIPGIDGLRAVAVLSVILFHLGPSLLSGGFAGVDVFFVISGYVVCGSLIQTGNSSFKEFVLGFYTRRVVRIFPALAVCLTVVGVLHTLLVPSSWLSTTAFKTGLAAFFGLSNFALIWFHDGYFSPRADFNEFTHTWSLAVEEQFYFVFPLIVFLWLKRTGKSGFSKAVFTFALPLLLLISLGYSAHETTSRHAHAYYLLSSRFWELASGALLFLLHRQGRLLPTSSSSADASLILGLILIGAGFVWADAAAFPFPWALPAVLGSVLVIAGVAEPARAHSAGWLLSNHAIVYIGKLSYSLYLWHWPVFVLFRWTTGLHQPVWRVLALLMTTMLAIASYYFVERGFSERVHARSRPQWHVLSGGLAAILGCAVIFAVMFEAQPQLSLSVTRDSATWYARAWPSSLPSNLHKATESRRIFLIGDSHANAYSTMLQMLEEKHGIKSEQFSMAGCAIVNLLSPSTARCAEFLRSALAKIEKRASPGDLVFLASLRMDRLGDQWTTFENGQVAAVRDATNSAARRMAVDKEADNVISRLANASLLVVIDAPKPVFKSPAFRCSDWFNRMNPVCAGGFELERSVLEDMRAPVLTSLNRLQGAHPNLIVWDPFPVLCPGPVCSAFDGDRPLFFDGDHLSAHGNRVLYPSFVEMLEGIWSTGNSTP